MKWIFLIPIVYLILAILTLSDYGFNSDEPFHFYRGQAYLHFFLTGKKDYSDLKAYPRLNTEVCQTVPVDERCKISPPPTSDTTKYTNRKLTYEDSIKQLTSKDPGLRRSFFQYDQITFNDVIKVENGHPPLGGILAALTNLIFYQNLKIMDDVEAHHLAEILLAFSALLGVAIFTFKKFGLLASVIATFSIASYPLFFSESHFNVKDIPEASFFTLTVITFYFGITSQRWKIIFTSALFAGAALGVKFNALFLPFIILPWLFFFILKKKLKFEKKNLSLFVILVSYPVLALLIFFILWPYLWPNPLQNIQQTIQFYKSSGIGTTPELRSFLFHQFDLFPIIWIVTTTPLPTLTLAILGVCYSLIKLIKEKKSVYLLLLLWLFVPITRVSLPNFAIYGGIRHIMEFIIPLGIFCGIGSIALLKIFEGIFQSKKRAQILGLVFLLLTSLFIVSEDIRIHPNENVYFNQLIGGLSGAKEKNIPFWGNSYGNAYLQGVNWLNENAEPNARVGLPIATMANLPRLKLRSDIQFNNGFWSGPNRKGEYEIELIYNYPQRSWYSFSYYDTFLNPIYETKVDGVAILKIWKNDLAHTREGFKEEVLYSYKKIKLSQSQLVIELEKEIFLTKVVIKHQSDDCQKQKGGDISISKDNQAWMQEADAIDYPQVPPEEVGWDDKNFVFLFPGKEARFLKLNTDLDHPCILEEPVISVYGLKKLP